MLKLIMECDDDDDDNDHDVVMEMSNQEKL